MNITMFHDLDTGFMAATLKPAFEALGHTCTIVQTLNTYLDPESPHVDHLLNSMTDEQIHALHTLYKETDLFITRTVSDFTLRVSGILPYMNQNNTIYRVHGSELRDRNVPYSLRTWRIDWHGKEPFIVAPRDPSLLKFYGKNVITHIERPCAFDTFPRKRVKDIYALHTPTNPKKKGTFDLIDKFQKEGTIPLHIIHGAPREEILRMKAGASYFIDYLESYDCGPYGMNSVEAWFYKIPVFSVRRHITEALVPETLYLLYSTTLDTIQKDIQQYVPNPKNLLKAHKYAKLTHDPIRIAQQYISLARSLEQ